MIYDIKELAKVAKIEVYESSTKDILFKYEERGYPFYIGLERKDLNSKEAIIKFVTEIIMTSYNQGVLDRSNEVKNSLKSLGIEVDEDK